MRLNRIKIGLSTLLLLLNICSYGTNIYVSLKGNVNHTGSKERSFARIARAQQVVRKLKGQVTIYLRGGISYFK